MGQNFDLHCIHTITSLDQQVNTASTSSSRCRYRGPRIPVRPGPDVTSDGSTKQYTSLKERETKQHSPVFQASAYRVQAAHLLSNRIHGTHAIAIPLQSIGWRARVCCARQGLALPHQLHKIVLPDAQTRLANRVTRLYGTPIDSCMRIILQVSHAFAMQTIDEG